MCWETVAIFTDAETFLNLCIAYSEIKLGDCGNMFRLGAKFGLNPNDLLMIVEKNQNLQMTKTKVIDLVNAGLNSLNYTREFKRLSVRRFFIKELRILAHGSIDVNNVVIYDEFQLLWTLEQKF
jgi:hypothetical protein